MSRSFVAVIAGVAMLSNASCGRDDKATKEQLAESAQRESHAAILAEQRSRHDELKSQQSKSEVDTKELDGNVKDNEPQPIPQAVNENEEKQQQIRDEWDEICAALGPAKLNRIEKAEAEIKSNTITEEERKWLATLKEIPAKIVNREALSTQESSVLSDLGLNWWDVPLGPELSHRLKQLSESQDLGPEFEGQIRETLLDAASKCELDRGLIAALGIYMAAIARNPKTTVTQKKSRLGDVCAAMRRAAAKEILTERELTCLPVFVQETLNPTRTPVPPDPTLDERINDTAELMTSAEKRLFNRVLQKVESRSTLTQDELLFALLGTGSDVFRDKLLANPDPYLSTISKGLKTDLGCSSAEALQLQAKYDHLELRRVSKAVQHMKAGTKLPDGLLVIVRSDALLRRYQEAGEKTRQKEKAQQLAEAKAKFGREWTDAKTGKPFVRAEFLYLNDGMVGLRKFDGTETVVPAANLSTLDIKWIEEEVVRIAAAEEQRRIEIKERQARLAEEDALRRKEAEERFGRAWHDKSGSLIVRGEFLSFRDGKVNLKKFDGTGMSIPTSSISSADHKWIQEEVKRRRPAPTAKNPKKDDD